MDILRPDFPDNNPDAEMIRLAVERLEAMSAAVEKTKNVSSPNSPPFNNCIKCGKDVRINDHKLCRTCWNAYTRSRYSYDQERDRQLRHNYGISLDEYNALSHAQDDVCAVCKEPEKLCKAYVACRSRSHHR